MFGVYEINPNKLDKYIDSFIDKMKKETDSEIEINSINIILEEILKNKDYFIQNHKSIDKDIIAKKLSLRLPFANEIVTEFVKESNLSSLYN